jgi:curved DNA-binding protein CbpA
MKLDQLAIRNQQHISPRSIIHHDLGNTTTDRTRNPSRFSFVTKTLSFHNHQSRADETDQTPPVRMSQTFKLTNQPKVVPFVSKLTVQQTLPLIFSAFWNGADLYEDVLGVEPTQKQTISSARLRLLYFRKGREVLASPVEVDDEITTLTYQGITTSSVSINSSKRAIRSGVPISRKAKKRFQAICLAYEVLSDPHSRSEYDTWLQMQPNQQSLFSNKAKTRTSSTRLDSIIERISSMPTIQETERDSFYGRLTSRADSSFSSDSDIHIKSSGYEATIDDHDLSRSFSTTSSGYDSILRPSRVSRSKRSVTPTKIRWNEQVEELVIMDYDAKNEHFTRHNHHSKAPASTKNKSTRTPRYDDDDVWNSRHPFFPEQEIDSPFNQTCDIFPSQKPHRKNIHKYKNGKVMDKMNGPTADCLMRTEYDDDEISDDDFEQIRDDCGVPLAFDLASGFQVALSKYLGNVLTEMKSGLSELGKTFSDMDAHYQVPTYDKQCGNDFFMDDYEVNALMSVLRTEMNQNPVND